VAFDTDALILTRHLRRGGEPSSFYRAVRDGRFVRLATGAYVPRATWDGLSADERFLARVHATAHKPGSRPVFGYLAAAAIWRLPMVAAWPAQIDLIAERGSRRSSRDERVRGEGAPADVVIVDGLAVTSLARTLVDVARSSPPPVALAMVDFALSTRSTTVLGSPIDRDALVAAVEEHDVARGRASVRRVLELADGACDSPGESVSRATMHVLGVPRPVLQQRFVDAEGEMFADFWWPEFGVVAEFDGYGKYVRTEYMRPGESTADVVIREKRREDRIRTLGPTLTRWDWPVAWSTAQLGARLRGAGVRW
jgi:hypothetical protein